MGMFTTTKQPYQLYENHKKYLGYVNPNTLNYDKPVYVLVNDGQEVWEKELQLV